MNKVLDPLVSEFENTEQEQSYNEWIQQKVEKSINDTRPMIPHDQVVARLKKLREELQKNAQH